MSTFSRRKILSRALMASLIVLPVMHAAAQAAPLDGKVFVADAGIKGKEADEKGDIITFKDGMFHSKICDQYGYGKAEYKATAQGDAITFETIRWTLSFTKQQMLALTATYSPVVRLPQLEKQQFLKKMGHIVDDDFGGVVTRNFVSAIYTAVRPAEGVL